MTDDKPGFLHQASSSDKVPGKMTRDQFAEFLDAIQHAEREVRAAGQAEYAHDNDNCFANFERIGNRLKCSGCGKPIGPEIVLLVYALKHEDGIIAFINGHKSQREDVRGRIKDLRLYLALLWGMIEGDGGR